MKTSLKLDNCTDAVVLISVEPLADLYELSAGRELDVTGEFENEPNGGIAISIRQAGDETCIVLYSDGPYQVVQDGHIVSPIGT